MFVSIQYIMTYGPEVWSADFMRLWNKANLTDKTLFAIFAVRRVILYPVYN